jgi:2-(acetamidomethylene)succinate hydrolase
MGGNGALWRAVGAGLEDFADILAVDQRGHGASRTDPDDPHFAPLDYAADVAETAAAESFSPAWVVGHSMGVRTACGYAKLSPGAVSGLILVDLGLWSPAGGGIGDSLRVFLADLPETFPSRAEARAFLAERCPDPAIAQYLIAVSRTDPATGAVTFPFEKCSLLKTIDAAEGSTCGAWVEEYARTTGRPVKVLRGVTSEVYTHEEFESDRARFAALPNVEFFEVEGAGHGLPFERRVEFVGMIRGWIGV